MTKRVETSNKDVYRLLNLWAAGKLIEVPWEKIQEVNMVPPSVKDVLHKMEELRKDGQEGLQVIVVFEQSCQIMDGSRLVNTIADGGEYLVFLALPEVVREWLGED